MSFEISEWNSNHFKSAVSALAQQQGSRLMGSVRNDGDVIGERVFFDRLGATEASEKITRFADTPLTADTHSRRSGIVRDYNWAKLVEGTDRVKTNHDPTSHYLNSAMWAMGRKKDSLIIEAANGTAYSGKNGTTAVQLPAGQKIAAGAAGLTLAKLIEAREKLDAAEIDPDELRYCVVTAKQVSNLLNTTEVKSEDYNEVKSLVQGSVDTFMGFTFIRTERLTVDGSGNRLVLCFAKPAIGMMVAKEPESNIATRPDKSNALQVYVEMSMGATRIEDEGVVQIACVEA